MNSNPRKRPCSYNNPQTGRACRAWAVRHSHPPRCRAHLNTPTQHGLVAQANSDLLGPEIANVRAVVGQVISQLHAQLPPPEFARLVNLVFTGSTTIARLLRAQRALTGNSADGLAEAIAQVLEEVATEWGIEP